jgi:hypothetical protein
MRGSGQGLGLGLGVSLRGPKRGQKREDLDCVRKSHRHNVRSCDWRMVWSELIPWRWHSRSDMVLRQWNYNVFLHMSMDMVMGIVRMTGYVCAWAYCYNPTLFFLPPLIHPLYPRNNPSHLPLHGYIPTIAIGPHHMSPPSHCCHHHLPHHPAPLSIHPNPDSAPNTLTRQASLI